MPETTADALVLGEVVRVERHGGVGLVTLARADKLNAFDDTMAKAMEVAIESALDDADIRVLVITGEGRGFCAGADLAYLEPLLAAGQADEAAQLVASGSRIAQAISASPKPVIAALNGTAVGGGAGLAVACDLRFAAESAKIGFVFGRLGLAPDWSSTYHLPRLVGAAKALELFWSADVLSAAEAERIGLVNRVLPSEALLDTVLELATTMAARPAAALQAAKEATTMSGQRDLATMLRWEEHTQRELFRSDAAKRALSAFLERKP